jgi:putative DNA primase/helicase
MSEAHSALATIEDFKPKRLLRADTIGEFVQLEIPPREMILGPVIPAQGLVMVYAPRGVGKTLTTLGMAYAVASGGSFLRWRAEKPRKVLYVDGEMPAIVMQERMQSFVMGAAEQPPTPEHFRLITPDRQDMDVVIPDLSTKQGQEALEEHLGDGVDLLVLDNLSSLCRSGRENEAESWEPLQTWLLELRRRGLSVVFVHHAGKGGNQRGTSKREDTLDTIISLRRPEDYDPSQGARFIIHYEKSRSFHGDEAKAFEAKMEVVNGAAMWTTLEIEDASLELVRELLAEGKSLREVQKETGIPKSTVQRMKRRIAEGEI